MHAVGTRSAKPGRLRRDSKDPRAADTAGGVADEETVDMAEPKDPPAPEPDGSTGQDACPCGSRDHAPLRIGEKLSPSGGAIAVYVCPAESPAGLRGVL